MLAAGVDPALLSMIPPDSTTLAGIQVTQAQSTRIGQNLMSMIQLDAGTTRAMAEAGFDLRRDLREILVAAGGTASNPAVNVTLLGRGTFHPEKISAAAVQAGAVLSTYHGVRLIEPKNLPSQPPSGPQSGRGTGTSLTGSVAFLDASTMLAGDAASVKAAIDRRAAKATYTGALADRARQLSAASDLWIVTLPPPAGLAPSPAPSAGGAQTPFANILNAAQQLSAGLKIGANDVTLSAEILTKSPQDAQSMANILKFSVQMLAANRQEGQSAGPSIADAAKITVSGSILRVLISVPEKQLEPLFGPGANAPKRLAGR